MKKVAEYICRLCFHKKVWNSFKKVEMVAEYIILVIIVLSENVQQRHEKFKKVEEFISYL